MGKQKKSKAVKASKQGSELWLRCFSGLAIILLTLAFVYWGRRPLVCFAAFLGTVSLYEWTRMFIPVPRSAIYGVAAGLAGLSLLGIAALNTAAAVPAVVAILAAFLFVFMRFRGFDEVRNKVSGGFFYIVLSLSCLVLLAMYAGEEKTGRFGSLVFAPFDKDALKVVIAFLFIIVWSSDTLAYIFGKLIGGPKLAVKLSPKKTWAGLFGSMTGAALALMIGSYVLERYYGFTPPPEWMLAVFGGFLGIVGQIGDLAISYFKRAQGIKDIGNLIPGHGGVLDRIDAMLLILPFYYLAFRAVT